MRYLITLLLVVGLATPALAFDLDEEVRIAAANAYKGKVDYREAFIQEANKNVLMSAENATLKSDLEQSKGLVTFLVVTTAMWLWYDLNRNRGGDDCEEPKPRPKPCAVASW